MRAVNLIPADARRRLGAPGRSGGLAYVLIGLLGAAVLLVLVAVLTSNTIAERQARVGRLQREAAAARALATRLAPYTEFEQLAEQRSATVREIAAARFDWHAALAQLARVIPPDTSLQSLTGTVAPGAGSGGSGGAASLRADIANPALELTGCTRSQDEVARLISRLRLMSGVTRVSLEDSQAGSQSTAGASAGDGSSGCPAGAPSFDLVVFFEPLPGAGPAGLTPSSGGMAPASGATGAASGAAGTASGTAGATSGAAGTASGTAGATSGAAGASSGAPAARGGAASAAGGAPVGSAAPTTTPPGAG